MVIFVKIIKLGQLQIPVESREPIMHSVAIAEQKKLHIEGFLCQQSSQKIPKVTMAIWSQILLGPDEFKYKKFLL